MTPTAAGPHNATIEPTVPHIAIAATAAASVRAEGLAGAVYPGFCSARSDEDLDEIAREQIAEAAKHLVWAAHARELLERRRATRAATATVA